jgi:hypothetical protein
MCSRNSIVTTGVSDVCTTCRPLRPREALRLLAPSSFADDAGVFTSPRSTHCSTGLNAAAGCVDAGSKKADSAGAVTIV